MLIGFMGSHGTGKTTTAEAVSGLTGATLLGSTARTSASLGQPVNKEATQFSQLMLTVSRANQAANYSGLGGNWVADRTPLDSYAYSLYQVDNMWPENQITGWYMKESYDLVRHHMDFYDHLFYFPIFWPVEDDGLRNADIEYQKDIDRRVQQYIKDLGLVVTEVPMGSRLQRVQFIKDTTHMV